ncbi:MAG TPA: hypothetical protein VFU46_14500 [Gemmatimonadales bacterium]|nr:hypothetical protein [Gemmatimonadales bacterium]
MNLVHCTWIPAALLMACAADAGSAGEVTVEAKLPVTFAQVSNVIEVDGGRIAFAGDRHFLMADLATGRMDTIGARADSVPQGAPASVYKFPGWVAHLAGDTVALVDFAAIRTTLWTERGQAVAALAIPPAGGPTPVLAYDHAGFGYKTDYRALLGSAEPGRAGVATDSIAVLRIQLATSRVDTVARLAAPEYGDARFGEQTQQVAKIFGPNDVFGVLPDGRVWVARARENRVDWRGPGGVWIRGEPRDYARLAVTDADRARVLERIREQGRGRGLPDGLRLEWPFAEHKPPFEAGMASAAGEVWLQRPRTPDVALYVYDVYGPDAAWKRAVRLPPEVTLAGFGGSGAIYGVGKEGERRTVVRLREQ